MKHLKSDLKVSALLLATAVAGVSEATVIDQWLFNEAAGTELENTTNTGPNGSAWPTNIALTTNGLGSMVYDSSTVDQFFQTIGGSLSSDSGQYEMLFEIDNLTVLSTTGPNGVTGAGFSIRGVNNTTNAVSNIAPILFQQSNGGIRLLSFNGFNQYYNYANTTQIDNVTVRAVLTLNGTAAGNLDIYMTDDNVDLGAGVGNEAYLGSSATGADLSIIGMATYKQRFDVGESATIDTLQLSLVPEPSSLALMFAGAGLMLCRKRSAD